MGAQNLAPDAEKLHARPGGNGRPGDGPGVPVDDELDLDQHRLDVVDRQAIEVLAGGNRLGQVARVQIADQGDGLGVATRIGRAVLDDQIVSEILDQRQPVLDAGGQDPRRRIAEGSERLGHGEEGADVGRELGDRRIRLAEADDRAVGPGRRHHQDRRRAVAPGQALVEAHRSVALQEFAPGLEPADAVQQRSDAERPRQAPAHPAAAAHLQEAEVGPPRGVEPDRHFESIGRQRLSDALRPFDDGDRVVDRLVPAEVFQLQRSAQAIKVGVDDRSAPTRRRSASA